MFRSRVTDAARERRANDDPARDGPHVVRRPRDDALVGRPVAQRELRRPTWATLRRGRGHALPRRLDRLRARASRPGPTGQDQLPTTHPIVADIVDTRRGRGQLRRDHLRQGRRRCSSSWSPGSGEEAFVRGAPRVLRRATPGATPSWRDFLAALEAPSGRDLEGLVDRVWLETAGVTTLRAARRGRPDGAYTRVAIHQEAARRATRPCGPPSGAGRLRPGRRAAAAAHSDRARCRGRRDRRPGAAAACRQATCCW